MSQDNVGKRISYGDPKRISLSSVAKALKEQGVKPADVEAYGKGGKVLSKKNCQIVSTNRFLNKNSLNVIQIIILILHTHYLI